MKEKSKAIYRLVVISMSVAFITVCSWLSFPFAVKFSLQTFAIFTVAAAFPASVSIISVALYILLGLIGIPVFSGFSSGLTALLGASGGFIIAFIPATVLISLFRKKYFQNPWIHVATASLSALICYTLGCIWYMLVFSPGVPFWSALTISVIPFIIPDAFKILLSTVILKNLQPYIKKIPL